MQLRPCFYLQCLCYGASHLQFQGIVCFIKQLAQPISSSSCARVPLFKRKLIFDGFLTFNAQWQHLSGIPSTSQIILPQFIFTCFLWAAIFHCGHIKTLGKHCLMECRWISRQCVTIAWRFGQSKHLGEAEICLILYLDLESWALLSVCSTTSTWQWLRQAWISHHIEKEASIFTESSLGCLLQGSSEKKKNIRPKWRKWNKEQ